jgi:post-segregation antitoxin (ccd killing protein)
MQLNIYLPDELGERVRAADGLNVSQICQVALRQELEMIEAQERADTDLEAAAARLRKSHGDWKREVKALGTELGADFAKKYAEWDELVEIDGDVTDGAWQTYEVDAIEEYLSQVEDLPRFERDIYSDPFYSAFMASVVKTFREVRKLM